MSSHGPRSTLAIVVSYNDATSTINCVASLKDQARVVVWDNASKDTTTDAIKMRFPDVTLHECDYNAMWTPALNGAMEEYYDGEDYILFSNNDIAYPPGVIPQIRTGFADPSAGIVAPAGSNLGGQQDFAYHHPCPSGTNWDQWVAGRPTVRANYVVGASMMVSREAWEDIGPLDNDMPLGADDHDYCIRAKENGWSIWVVNSAYVRHKGHASGQKARHEWNEWGKRSWDVFNKKWAGYFFNEEEAKKVHWRSEYTPGWDVGTGWLEPEERQAIWDMRNGSSTI